jgi:hypothetical protein
VFLILLQTSILVWSEKQKLIKSLVSCFVKYFGTFVLPRKDDDGSSQDYNNDDNDDDDNKLEMNDDSSSTRSYSPEKTKTNEIQPKQALPLDLTVKTPPIPTIKTENDDCFSNRKRHRSFESTGYSANGDESNNENKHLLNRQKKLNKNQSLLQMQSIANSYLNNGHPNVDQAAHNHAQHINLLNNIRDRTNLAQSKPLKSVLPPVSQEQFDKYTFINTDDLVRRVKDLLSKYSISQRLFGEYILGLSQGSVSDLLARPKPWIMLTQKGREPFIRMQIFIDDSNAIKKLMANQYKVPPEKITQRSFNANSSTNSQSLPNAISYFNSGQANGMHFRFHPKEN